MRERPIIFRGPMIRAILEGRKTQTRRVIKHHPFVGPPGDWCPRIADVDFQRFVGDYRDLCPCGQPGDRLWVREAHALDVPGCERGISYRADHRDPKGDGPAHPMRWRPSIHMPRWASRITLEIMSVRAERVHHISEADARAEGVESVAAFRELWDSINTKRALWGSAPWVWMIEFRSEEMIE